MSNVVNSFITFPASAPSWSTANDDAFCALEQAVEAATKTAAIAAIGAVAAPGGRVLLESGRSLAGQ